MYAPTMKRLQIMIDEDLDAALELLARQEGTSKAALIRRFVRDRIRPLPPVEEDPLWRLVEAAEREPIPEARPEPSIDEVVYEWPSSTPPSG
jgi:hypothetical protein